MANSVGVAPTTCVTNIDVSKSDIDVSLGVRYLWSAIWDACGGRSSRANAPQSRSPKATA